MMKLALSAMSPIQSAKMSVPPSSVSRYLKRLPLLELRNPVEVDYSRFSRFLFAFQMFAEWNGHLEQFNASCLSFMISYDFI